MITKLERFLVVIPVLFVTLCCVNLTGQTIRAEDIRYIPEIEVTFSEGINEYRNGNYEEATRIFEELLNQYPPHQRITAVYMMLGKCYYKIGVYKKAILLLDNFIKKYPQSKYVNEAYYTKGFCYYEMGEYINSLNTFFFVADNAKEATLIKRSRNNALNIIENNITLNEIQQLRESTTGEISSTILTIKLAQRFLAQGDRDKAISLLQNFVQQHPKNPYLKTVQDVLNRTHIDIPSEEVSIGVILPLSGEYAEQAKAVLAGIHYVQKKFNNNSDIKIKLVVKDSEGDMAKVVKSAQELAMDNRIIAIIGELEREKTIAIAAVLNNLNIPLISPTTSGNGVASLNEYTFQINCDLENRGHILAKYAIEELGLSTFATLAPADDYGKDMTDSFASTVDQFGGKIIAQKWYYTDAQDLKRQFQSIRELGFNLVNKDSLIEYYTKVLDNFEEEKIPVNSIDGVFFPCYTEEIQYIAPQFALANIKAQIIGGEYWYDIDRLRANQNYLEGIIFCSGYYFDETSPEFIKFRNDFRTLMKRTPEIMESYGYDAMKVVIDAIAHKQTTRVGVKNHLDKLKNFQGLRGSITLMDNSRVNSEIRILTYRNGKIELLR